MQAQTQEKIKSLVTDNDVILFMKGTPQTPMCGFSAQAVSVLGSMLDDFAHINVLEDEEIRQGIKEYGNWPTIPQLYINGELVGGSDIITEAFNKGELHQALGLKAPDRTPPAITVTDAAAEAIKSGMQDAEGAVLHFSIDAGWQNQFMLKPAQGHEIVVEDNGIKLHMDLATAGRANDVRIDWVEEMDKAGLAIHNPNAPAPVKPLSVSELKTLLDGDQAPAVVDVRPEQQRDTVAFPHASYVLDQEGLKTLESLPKDTPLAFLCHHGQSSQGAAEHFRKQGFTNIFNVTGGIDAWAAQIDSDMPRY
jgi:monothiol glutaredoxin